MIDFRKEYSNGNLNAENFKKIEKLSSSILQEHFKILDHYIKDKRFKLWWSVSLYSLDLSSWK